ncbi:hypothetical protein BWK58_07515 [Flavobacterium columnare]|nr:hypothetical protein BWK58_07515 [Flavobacterium columnare]
MKGRQFNQKISIEKAAEISEGAIKNAKSLLDDAKLLFENGKYPRAISLAILSIEESGKPSIIRSIILEDDPKEISNLWKSFRKHQDKNSMWIVPELLLKGARTLESLRKVVDPKSDHSQTLDTLKQLCFYSDVFTKGKLSLPENVGNKDLAKSLIIIAETSIKETLNSVDALEIWVKHLKPVWKTDISVMKKALLSCYIELEEKNLIEDGMANKMSEFLQ